LAGATSCPNRSIVGPSGKSEGETPSGDAREEVALGVASEVIGLNIDDTSLVNVTGSDVSSRNEIAEPLGCIRVDFVVIGIHAASLSPCVGGI
jgi:hypothetical protein